jgi:hypothetical protein
MGNGWKQGNLKGKMIGQVWLKIWVGFRLSMHTGHENHTHNQPINHHITNRQRSTESVVDLTTHCGGSMYTHSILYQWEALNKVNVTSWFVDHWIAKALRNCKFLTLYLKKSFDVSFIVSVHGQDFLEITIFFLTKIQIFTMRVLKIGFSKGYF